MTLHIAPRSIVIVVCAVSVSLRMIAVVALQIEYGLRSVTVPENGRHGLNTHCVVSVSLRMVVMAALGIEYALRSVGVAENGQRGCVAN